ncbi:hypothetical protein G6F42_026669 [Rhizopus arrhizus]|nr:hypothetical protein G6F42_026669 [Rhizopus arrhizus]
MTITRNLTTKRDRFAFSKNLLRKFIREYASKDTYIGAPWVVKPEAAERFGIDVQLPEKLQLAKDFAYSKSRKKRKDAIGATNGNVKEEAELNDARRIEATLKYPVEDLNVPTYRRDPSESDWRYAYSPPTQLPKHHPCRLHWLIFDGLVILGQLFTTTKAIAIFSG